MIIFCKKVLKIFCQSKKTPYLCTRKRGKKLNCKRFLTYFHRQEVVQEMRIEPSILNAINESNSAEGELRCALSFFFARRK